MKTLIALFLMFTVSLMALGATAQIQVPPMPSQTGLPIPNRGVIQSAIAPVASAIQGNSGVPAQLVSLWLVIVAVVHRTGLREKLQAWLTQYLVNRASMSTAASQPGQLNTVTAQHMQNVDWLGDRLYKSLAALLNAATAIKLPTLDDYVMQATAKYPALKPVTTGK